MMYVVVNVKGDDEFELFKSTDEDEALKEAREHDYINRRDKNNTQTELRIYPDGYENMDCDYEIVDIVEDMERWEYPYEYDEQICDASDEQLLKWADEADSWDEFSCGCLHDLCWRLDLGWNTIHERLGIEKEDVDADKIFVVLQKIMGEA